MKVQHHSGISAECIAASIYDGGPPIYTVVTRSPKFIDSEVRTHRMLSQNSSSSRAIPVAKVIEQVKQNPYIPFEWRKNQAGMQGYEIIDGSDASYANKCWLTARDEAVRQAEWLAELGAHKQHINRLLEAFVWQWKVITATEWENFFNLRCHPAAQPEIQVLANCIRKTIESVERPVDRSDGSWHLPFIPDEERIRNTEESNLKVSTARCARISYANHGDKIVSRDKDIDLFNRLMAEKHRSPTEHQAKRMLEPYQVSHIDKYNKQWSGNLAGWYQHRKQAESNDFES